MRALADQAWRVEPDRRKRQFRRTVSGYAVEPAAAFSSHVKPATPRRAADEPESNRWPNSASGLRLKCSVTVAALISPTLLLHGGSALLQISIDALIRRFHQLRL